MYAGMQQASRWTECVYMLLALELNKLRRRASRGVRSTHIAYFIFAKIMRPKHDSDILLLRFETWHQLTTT